MAIPSVVTFFRRIAMRVSRSGGSTSVISLEARAQPFLERRDLLRRPVRRDDDLPPGLVERVERVEELLLEALLALRGTGCRPRAARRRRDSVA